MPTNDFVPFCNENIGTNLPTQSAYLANPALPIGNQPGIASSSLNNKAIRQGTTIAAILAQYTSNLTGASMLDNQNSSDHSIPAALLGALTSVLKYMNPVLTSYTSGTGNHNVTFKFQIASGNATVGATYSDGTTTYTVTSTISAGTELKATGAAAPAAVAGTLTKTGGTGDSTLTYYCYRSPLFLRVRMVGGGGGGGGSGTTGTGGNGGNGGNTTFGTSLLTAGLGSGGGKGISTVATGGGGGSATVASPASGNGFSGAQGGYGNFSSVSTLMTPGGPGGTTPFGGQGIGGANVGIAALVNTGSGGGGAGNGGNSSVEAGGGGGAGAFIDALIFTPSATYAYAVGAAGTAGTAGTTGSAGGAGAAGIIIVEEHYQ